VFLLSVTFLLFTQRQDYTDEQIYNYVSTTPSVRVNIGFHVITQNDMQGALCAPDGWLTDTIIDAFLELFQDDLHASSITAPVNFYIVDCTLTSQCLAARPTTDPFRPYQALEKRDYWIQEVRRNLEKYSRG